MKSRKSYCTTPGVGVGVGSGVGVSKKFNVKVFYVMGKALSGKLSCPYDRSCLKILVNPIALRKTKIVYNFGLNECNKVKNKINLTTLKLEVDQCKELDRRIHWS